MEHSATLQTLSTKFENLISALILCLSFPLAHTQSLGLRGPVIFILKLEVRVLLQASQRVLHGLKAGFQISICPKNLDRATGLMQVLHRVLTFALTRILVILNPTWFRKWMRTTSIRLVKPGYIFRYQTFH